MNSQSDLSIARPPSLFRFFAAQLLALVAAMMLTVVGVSITFVARIVGGGPIWILPVLGSGCGLVSLSAAWMALGPFGWKVRVVASPLAALGTLIIVAVLLAIDDPPEEIAIAALLAGLAQFVLLQASYWFFRWWLGLQVVQAHDPTVDMRSERFQFRLWEMLLVMTLVAVVLGLGRGLVSILHFTGGGGGPRAVLPVIFTLLVGYNLLLAWPLIWSVLSPTGRLWKTAVAITLGLLVTATELPAAEAFLGRGPTEFFWLINIPQIVFLLAHLVATRYCGYCLVRRRQPSRDC